MTSATPRTHWRPWTDACWTAGSCACRWRATAVPRRRRAATAAAVVAAPDSALALAAAAVDVDVRAPVRRCVAVRAVRAVAPIRRVHVPGPRAAVRRDAAASSRAVPCAATVATASPAAPWPAHHAVAVVPKDAPARFRRSILVGVR